MKIRDQKIADFIKDLASDKPTPGGGAVAALSGSMAAGLVAMVCNLTIGKKGYEKEQKDIKRLRDQVIKKGERLIELADEDVSAFEKVMAAYKGKGTSKQQRIEIALKYATEVPLETAKLSMEVQKIAKVISQKGNRNAYSDAKTAVYLSEAAISSALENVKINLKYIKDKLYIKNIKSQVKTFY
jgi:formiminotetrahydrofolate cyclodeaminase